MVALPAAGTVIWGVQALTPTFVTAETMARAGANKISYKHIEECTWHQNAKLSAKISNKTLISAKFYIVQWFMVYPNCNDLMVGIHAPWVCFLYG